MMAAAPSNPVVSVMLPVYNTACYLPATIEGLLGQTFGDFEIVAIDDGSKDDSLDVLNRYAKQDSRLRVIARPNAGIVRTRNEILAAARGEFLAVNDSDDVSLPPRFEKQVAYLREHPEVVVVGGYFQMIDSAGRLLTTLKPPVENEKIQDALLAGHCAICHSCGMYRRDAVMRLGGYGTEFKYAHDLELWLRLGEVGKLVNLPEPVLQFRLHESSVSEKNRVEQRNFARLACERACARRGVQREYEAAEPWRPGTDRASKHAFALQYGWWAFNSAQRRTAMYYGWKAITHQPFKSDGWRLLACAAIKPMRATA